MAAVTAQKKGSSAQGFRGELQSKPLEGLLFHLHTQKKSAEIILESGDLKRRIYLKDGKIIFYRDEQKKDGFLVFLQGQNAVTEEKRAQLKKMMEEKKERIEGISLLIEKNLEIRNLPQLTRAFVQSGVSECFSWQEGTFQMGPLAKELEPISMGGLEVFIPIYEGIKNIMR